MIVTFFGFEAKMLVLNVKIVFLLIEIQDNMDNELVVRSQ